MVIPSWLWCLETLCSQSVSCAPATSPFLCVPSCCGLFSHVVSIFALQGACRCGPRRWLQTEAWGRTFRPSFSTTVRYPTGESGYIGNVSESGVGMVDFSLDARRRKHGRFPIFTTGGPIRLDLPPDRLKSSPIGSSAGPAALPGKTASTHGPAPARTSAD